MSTIGSKIDEVRIDGSLSKLRQDLEYFQKIGLNAVELPVHGLDVILNGRLIQHRLDKILSVLKDFDFLYSIHSPNPVNLMDKKDAGLHADVLLASLEFARQVHAKVVVYHAGRFIPEEEFFLFPAPGLSLKEKEGLMEREALLLQSISGQYPDVTLAIENARPYPDQSPYTYGEFPDELKHQVITINRPNVKINLDFGHLYMTSLFHGYDLETAVTSIRAFIAHTHIHDNFGGAVHHWEKQQTHQLPFGRGDSHMPVGRGEVPIKDILDILLPDYTGLLMMELRSRYFDDLEESGRNLEAMIVPDKKYNGMR
ncbi:MAG: xylose isomerase [Desulfobacula sp. RIFOXYA12_FULL_46_16]|nr:MAG: xylose isomerase [Desulfobacula sp. RIFOXYA12_FULL_46_16]